METVLLKNQSIWLITLLLFGGAFACRPRESISPRSALTVSSDTGSIAEASVALPQQEEPPTPVIAIDKEESSLESAKPPVSSFAIYTLSKGKGVPIEAQAALRKIQRLVKNDQSRGVN